jgi:hypothetical protein
MYESCRFVRVCLNAQARMGLNSLNEETRVEVAGPVAGTLGIRIRDDAIAKTSFIKLPATKSPFNTRTYP